MLLIKCPQCQASYRLAESLYRRKAAGYGVVITCRHCKTQIHVDEGDEKTIAGDAASAASENEVTPARGPIVTGTPTPAKTAASAPRATAAAAHEDTADAAVAALPDVAPKPMAPRPAVAPRLVASAPRRGGTLLGIAPPGNTPAPTTGESGEDGWKPKLVALSPGLLGVGTAPRPGAGKSAPAAPPPPPPVPPAPEEEAAADSIVPISSSSVELIESLPPDSAVPLDSSDYLSTPYAPPSRDDDDDKTLVFAPTTIKAKDKRPLQAPPAPHPPHPPAAPHPPAKADFPETSDEEPTTARAPKTREPELDSSPLPLNQKKGEKPRKRQASGDLTDELLGSDISFGASPAIAPPDADALLRAPVSVRPPASDTRSPSSTKAPVSSSARQEKKGSGRGIAIVLVMAAFGGIGYALQHRALTREAPKPATDTNAVTAPVAEPQPPPPLETTTATAEASATPPEASASAAVASAEPVKEPALVAAPPTTGTTPSTGSTTTATGSTKAEKTPKAAPEKTSETTSTATTTREPPAPKSSEPSPAPTAAVTEPRGSVGTDPFDVAAARSALDASAATASSCRKEGDPSGVAVVTITFSQTGRVTSATISGPPFQATLTGSCIASTMRKTRVPAFAGDMVTVRKTVTIQ